jgi:hypothetical protein
LQLIQWFSNQRKNFASFKYHQHLKQTWKLNARKMAQKEKPFFPFLNESRIKTAVYFRQSILPFLEEVNITEP